MTAGEQCRALPYIQHCLSPVKHNLKTITACCKGQQKLENRYGDHHLAKSFHAQLRPWVQHVGKSLQESAAALDYLDHCTYFDSTEQHISGEVACAFLMG
jgi:hypothetical protein